MCSHLTQRSISEPSVEIVGGPDLYINRGSNANLTCLIRGDYGDYEGPNNVRWTHNNKVGRTVLTPFLHTFSDINLARSVKI